MQQLTRHRTVHPVLKGLVYFGMAVFVLWMGFQPPVTDPPPDLKALQAGTDATLQTAKAAMDLVEANNKLTELMLNGTAGGDSNSLRQIQQSLQANRDTFEKLVAEQHRQEDAMNRTTIERAKDHLSQLRRQRWFAGLAGCL